MLLDDESFQILSAGLAADLLQAKGVRLSHMLELAKKDMDTVELFGCIGKGDKDTALRLLFAATKIEDEDLADIVALGGEGSDYDDLSDLMDVDWSSTPSPSPSPSPSPMPSQRRDEAAAGPDYLLLLCLI